MNAYREVGIQHVLQFESDVHSAEVEVIVKLFLYFIIYTIYIQHF